MNEYAACAIVYGEVKTMLWYVCMGVLAAFGLLCAIWVILGLFLPRAGTVAILCDGTEKTLVRRYFWLRELGLIRCRLILLDSRLPAAFRQQIMEKCKDIEFLTLAQWLDRRNEERSEIV